jgi:hypothetical protein
MWGSLLYHQRRLWSGVRQRVLQWRHVCSMHLRLAMQLLRQLRELDEQPVHVLQLRLLAQRQG